MAKHKNAKKQKLGFKTRLAKVDALVEQETCPKDVSAAGFDKSKEMTKNQKLIKLNNAELNARPIGDIIDELNQDNPDLDSNKSYVDVDELGKGERIVFAINRLCLLLERARIGDYVSMMGSTRGMMIKNFLAGIARGFGYGIGFLVLAAIAIAILNKVVDLGIPFIGNLLADIMNYVEQIREGSAMIPK